MSASVKMLSGVARSIAKRAIASLINPLAARPAEVIMPNEFRGFAMRYSAAPAIEQRSLSLQLIEKLLVDPGAGAFLAHPIYERRFGDSAYYRHARIAAAFAAGDTDQAERLASDLFEKLPSAFNAWLLARCLRLGSNEVISHLREAIDRFGNDADLATELAAQLNWAGQTSAANAVLATVPAASIPFGEVAELKSELSAAIQNHSTIRTGGGDIYSDQMVSETWWRYWRYFNQLTEFQHNEPFVMAAILRRLGCAIEARRPKTVIDFGALCGEINYRLAVKFPDVNVVGVDRQAVIKRLNDEAYSLPNLHFRDGDIFDSLTAHDAAPVLFTHTRTTVLCYPDFVQTLYNECSDRGVETIVGLEPSGISRETMSFPDYASMDRSVAFRSVMMLHNYPAMLERAGYQITKLEMVPVSFLYFDDPGYHLLYFEATRAAKS